LLTDIVNDIIDVLSRVQHHGIMGAKNNGIAQSVGCYHNIFHDLLGLVSNIKIGPYRYAQKQG
jgi:hypothetical protein